MTGCRPFVLCGCVLLLSACSSKGYEIVEEPRAAAPVLVSVETVEEQSLKEVLQTPTTFVLPFGEHRYAWERARYFLKTYTDSDFKYSASDRAEVLRSSTDSQNSYIYQIERSPHEGGFKYTVYCLPNKAEITSAAADMNARNVSRFLQSGTLEVSHLTR